MEKKKTLVLGASLKPVRYSNMAINRLREHNIPVYAIGLREGEVKDVMIRKGTPYWDDVHTVTLYLNAKRQEGYYDYLLQLKPKRVIFNPGAENPELKKLLDDHGTETLERCTLVMLSLKHY